MDADNAVRSMRETGLPFDRAESREGAHPSKLRSAMINNVRSVQQIVR
ncbi:hypothetical protein GCM10027090_29200 [Sinomonas soli]